MDPLLKTAVTNMCWMADRIHQAHHFGADPENRKTWKECTQGVCGSMGYMLSQAGVDKDLNQIVVRP